MAGLANHRKVRLIFVKLSMLEKGLGNYLYSAPKVFFSQNSAIQITNIFSLLLISYQHIFLNEHLTN